MYYGSFGANMTLVTKAKNVPPLYNEIRKGITLKLEALSVKINDTYILTH